MMKVRLLRRLGQNPADSILERSDTEGEWLVSNGYAEAVTVDDDTPVRIADAPPRRGRGSVGARR